MGVGKDYKYKDYKYSLCIYKLWCGGGCSHGLTGLVGWVWGEGCSPGRFEIVSLGVLGTGVWGGWVWAKIINTKIINTVFVFINFGVGEGVATALRDLWGGCGVKGVALVVLKL